MNKKGGFTLIELMFSLAAVCLMLLIAEALMWLAAWFVLPFMLIIFMLGFAKFMRWLIK